MWFKNLQLFLLKEDFTHSWEELEQSLAANRYRPCGSLEVAVQGWHPPLGGDSEQLCFTADGCFLVCQRREEKILPASVVNDALADKVQQIEAEEARDLGRREKKQLKDEVYHDLLPRAFTRSSLTFAYVDVAKNWILVDAASPKKAEDLVSLLRKSLTSLPVRPLTVKQAPAEVMTRWLEGDNPPNDFVIADQCELRDPDQEGGIVHCRRQDLAGDEIQAHLKAGKRAVQLAVEWEERINLLLTDQPTARRLRFADELIEEAAETGGDDSAAIFDADFTLMSMELRKFIDRMIEVFGGVEED
jgi:recombination associated protein RdgC